MIELATIETRLSTVACPICRATGPYRLNPRGAAGYGETLHTAACSQCAYTFKVTLFDLEMLGAMHPDIKESLSQLACPSCEKRGVSFEFQCHPSVRACVTFMVCPACGHSFSESLPFLD